MSLCSLAHQLRPLRISKFVHCKVGLGSFDYVSEHCTFSTLDAIGSIACLQYEQSDMTYVGPLRFHQAYWLQNV